MTRVTVGGGWTSETESRRRLRTLVSPYTGIVTRTSRSLVSPDDARLVSIACELAGLGPDGEQGFEPEAGAARPREEEALTAALGEAAERYAASVVPYDELLLAPARALGPEAVRPERFALFADEQRLAPGFPYRRVDETTPLRWARGRSLDGRPCWLPAQLVYLAAELTAGEPPFAPATSSGLACGSTAQEATIAALLELLERDAFMLVWRNRLSLPRLDVSGDRDLCRFHDEVVAPSGLRCTTVDLSVFHGVPTVLALVRSEEPDPVALAVGAAAAPHVRTAWKRAVCEAFAARAWARALALAQPAEAPRGPADVVTFADHVRLYAGRATASAACFLDAAPETRPAADVRALEGETAQEVFDAIVQRFRRAGADAFLVDVTPPDLCAASLRVVRALAPELCALDVGGAAPLLGGRRLLEAPWRAGLVPARLERARLNALPHPFP